MPETLIKPRPGHRSGTKSKSSSVLADMGPESDETLLIQPEKNSTRPGILPKFGDNPLVDEASALLSMVGQLRCTSDYSDVNALRQVFISKIHDYENSLRAASISPEQTESARYCICSLIDETVLNTTWGSHSVWGNDSLLSSFHSQTWGGEYFYTLLDQNLSAPGAHINLLELQYLCISLGFVGKMRIEPQGMEQLDQYCTFAFEAIQAYRGELPAKLAPQTHPAIVTNSQESGGLPFWVTSAVFSVIGLSIYLFSSYSINRYSDPVFSDLNHLVQWESKVELVNVDEQQLLSLQQRLSTEVSRSLVVITPQSDRVRITISSSELFGKGQAELKSSFVPVLKKVARVLESTKGRVLVTGHTDNQPIFTSRYPSNWHLSLARATAVSELLSTGTSLQGRLWPEGRGDSEPITSNDNDAGRAINRRVEIDLLY